MERLDFENNKYSPIEATIHLARYLNAKPYIRGKRVLDAACGEGYGSRLMREWGAASVVGVDISETAISKADKLFGSDQVKYLVHDVDTLPFPDNSFDVVVSLETIEHLNNPSQFLKELRRVLKKNGTAIISCPNDNYYAQNIPDFTNIYHKRRYSWPEYRELVEAEFGETTKWFMGNSLSGYINLPLMYCNDPETSEKAPVNMQSIFQARHPSEIEVVPQDQYVNHWVSVYYVAIWTHMEIEGSGESAAIYPVPTFFLHNDKKIPEVDAYDMVKALESQNILLRESCQEAQKKLVLATKDIEDMTAEIGRLEADVESQHLLQQEIQQKNAKIAELNEVISALEQERDEHSATAEELRILLEQLNTRQEQENIDNRKRRQESELFTAEIAEQKKKISLLEQERDEHSATAEELRGQCEELRAKQKQYAELADQNRVLTNERDRLKQMNAMLSEEQNLLNVQIGHLSWQLEQYTKLYEEARRDSQQQGACVERMRGEIDGLEAESTALRERERVLINERDRLKGMNAMLAEENRMLGARADQLLYACGIAEERSRALESSLEYRFGLRCRPLLKMLKKPLLIVMGIARKMKRGVKKVLGK